MLYDRDLEKMKEINEHMVDNARDIAMFNDGTAVSTTDKASATHTAVSKP
ncbi:hypothetical protein [Burkholderia ambifaria]|nr:hypothetical protein [Burkholderia ambifaria]